MEELEEALYKYRCGIRDFPTYQELVEFIDACRGEIERAYDRGYDEGSRC